MTARTHIQVRISEPKVKILDHFATHHELTRSDVIRACLAVAFKHDAELIQVLEGMS